ncbi:beta-mannosidase [Ascosphaera apis ARSEF 7405]|uniref:Beta-mannosidase A n=1 Tax=Ascosphaera apis ARSEF 7405 TaxID=392613 RepID=A0A162J4X8_9EURO|nr:beta-mannosidase [Ascosphaera apis ARSEF 7405]
MLLNKLAPALWLATLASAQHVVNLTESEWTVSNDNDSISVPAKFPSQVHLDLHDAGIIPEPYDGVGDLDLRWIALANWTYATELLNLKKDASQSYLVFDGLDTFATVQVCGQTVGQANNQFRQWTFDISKALQSCHSSTPSLTILFESAIAVANRIAEQPGQEQWPESVEGLFEFPNRQFIRKEQSDFGWDWGPAFAPAGPWKPGYVVQFDATDGVYVLNTDIDIFREGQINHLPADQSKPWVVNASIDYLGIIEIGASLTLEIKESETSSPIVSAPLNHINRKNATITGDISIDHNLPNLWWPSGLGEQNLYYITVKVVDSNKKTVASVTKRSGFRTILLNQTPITNEQLEQGIAPGANWHFEVNGHEFYAKGSNMIPPDAFWPRVTEEYISRLFDAVVAGNQNMLRVWASNIYLPDFIYDLADERGILLWSELQFGDALYPGMGEMTIAVERFYPAPLKYDPVANFSIWCLATQRFQSDYYKSQIQFYRRGSGRPERQLGSLYWQLEDIWQAPSWAGIEYGGRWKTLHYTAKDAYEPIIVAPFWNRTTGQLNVTVISDLWESVSGNVSLRWYDLRGRDIPGNAGVPTSIQFSVGPLNTTDIINTDMETMKIVDEKNCILIMTLNAEGHRPNSEEATMFRHENYFLPAYPSEAKIIDPKLSWHYDEESHKFKIQANKGVALYTWFEHPRGTLGHFSENNFVLLPHQTKEIEFYMADDKTGGNWLDGVSVQSLWDQSQYNWT